VNVAAQRLDPDSLWYLVQRMIAIRKANPVFGLGSLTWVNVGTPAVAAYWREVEGTAILILNNLSGTAQTIDHAEIATKLVAGFDLLLGNLQSAQLPEVLAPHEYLWLKVKQV
jgi:maltose alpha-D-glucosyltransferase/alpha-amylase